MTTKEHYQTLLVVWDPFQNIPVVVYILMHMWGKKSNKPHSNNHKEAQLS